MLADIRSGWECFQSARRAAASGRPVEALAELARATTTTPGNSGLFLAVADLYAELGDRDNARLYWRAAASRSAAGSNTFCKSYRRLALDAARRNRTNDAIRFMKQSLAFRPDDPKNAIKLLGWQLEVCDDTSRAAVVSDFCRDFTFLRKDLVERALLLPFDNPERAKVLLPEWISDFRRNKDFAVLAIDTLCRANLGDLALKIAGSVFSDEDLTSQELSVLLRTQRAAGRTLDDSLSTLSAYLGNNPDDRSSRVRKARILIQKRRWGLAYEEAAIVLGSDPVNIAAAEIAVQALIRLDRPGDAAALRDRTKTLFLSQSLREPADLVSLDLIAADPQSAVQNTENSSGNIHTRPEWSHARVDALMALGDYASALDLLNGSVRTSSDLALRAKAIQCSSALNYASSRSNRFPGRLFEVGLSITRRDGRRRASVALVTSTLAAGGAERQITLTASRIAPLLSRIGLDTYLICRDLRPEYGHSSMLSMMADSTASVIDLSDADIASVGRDLVANRAITPDDFRLLSGFPLNLQRSIIVLYDQFIRTSPQVVHLWQDGIIAVGGVAAAMAGVPRIVASLRNVVPPETDTRRYRTYLSSIYRTLATRADVTLTANSEMGARDYERKFGLESGSIAIIRNALETDAISARAGANGRQAVRESLGWGDDIAVLGGVFRLVPAKRPHRWLQVAAAVAKQLPTARFLIAGDGPLRAELEEYAATLGIGERTVFAGRQSPVEPWIAAMDTMLLASDLEGLPNVLLEAQALGVAVVTTDAGGSREAVNEGVSGTLVLTTDENELAGACLEFLSNTSRRDRARVEGPRFIRERFGLDRMLNETLSAYGLAT
jgi:glycosyltransferase involved in cell wall biosynthesis/tetratricopeptide (TPR) repeat protein